MDPLSSVRQPARIGRSALIATLALSLTGCGKASLDTASQHSVRALEGPGVPSSAVAVIEGWSQALRSGKPQRAAAYWAHPSTMVNGTEIAGRLAVIPIDTERQALLADESLSCGAKLTSTAVQGPYVEANFELSLRGGAGASKSGCSGPASVDFLIENGHIVRWLRAATSTGRPPAEQPSQAAGSQPV